MITVIKYSGQALELGDIMNLVDQRRSNLSCSERLPFLVKSITHFDDLYAVAKFSKSRVSGIVPEGSSLIFEGTWISF